MKKMIVAAMVLIAACIFAVPTGFAADKKYSGFLGDNYKNLGPGPEGGAKERWIKPGIDFTKYKRVMLDSVVFYFADDSENKGIDAGEMKELSDAFNLEIVNAMKEKYPIVADPGPDVVRIRIAITGIKKSNPVTSAITSIIPVGIGISLIKKGVTGSYTGSGGTTAEFMALDSVTNEVIVAAVDERSAGYTERFTSLGAAKEAFKVWAGKMKAFMDSMQAPKAQ